MNRNTLLKTVPIFSGLDSQDLNFLAESLTTSKHHAGEIIFNQGDIGHTMYIVAKGCINISVIGNNDLSILVKSIKIGEYFGELSLIDDKPRSASAIAETDVDLLELSREMLVKYLDRHPHGAMAILRTMSERLRETNILLSQRASKNVDEEIEKNLTWSDRVADRVAELNGSWMFIIFLGAGTVGWMLLNSREVLGNSGAIFDPYPFVFFNLLLAIVVALQGPLIVMSQNRRAIRDRIRSEADYRVNLKNEVNIEMILKEHQLFRHETTDRLQILETKIAGLRNNLD